MVLSQKDGCGRQPQERPQKVCNAENKEYLCLLGGGMSLMILRSTFCLWYI